MFLSIKTHLQISILNAELKVLITLIILELSKKGDYITIGKMLVYKYVCHICFDFMILFLFLDTNYLY